jgi:hypothetical protein
VTGRCIRQGLSAAVLPSAVGALSAACRTVHSRDPLPPAAEAVHVVGDEQATTLVLARDCHSVGTPESLPDERAARMQAVALGCNVVQKLYQEERSSGYGHGAGGREATSVWVRFWVCPPDVPVVRRAW